MNWFRSAIKSVLERQGVDLLPRLVTARFLDREYLVRNGVVDDGDYDDAWIHALARHSTNVFDVGSNIGQSAFNMLHAPGVECVVLIDPSPLALTVAADTLIRNQFGHRVRFVNAFVSDVAGGMVRFTGGRGTGGHIVDGEGPDASSAVSVPTTTVDDIAQRVGLTPDFVKFDVNGFEGRILAGSSTVAAQERTRFLIEMHRGPGRPQEQVTNEVLDWCRSNKYAAWYLAKGVRITAAEPVKHRGRYHLLLQPEAWPYPSWLVGIEQKADVSAAIPAKDR